MRERADVMREQPGGVGTADQRREQMLRAALDVIAERGFGETRIADVAERAGTSPALVIYYFKTKDQLLTEAIRFSEDTWYETGTRRMASISTAAGRLEELVAMSCLPEADTEPCCSWLLWLDLWAQAVRHPEVASVRQKFDERWRDMICSLVVEGQEAGEFGPVDPVDFAVLMSALLDGLAVQIALDDPSVGAYRAFELSMRFAAGQLGVAWTPAIGGLPRRACAGRVALARRSAGPVALARRPGGRGDLEPARRAGRAGRRVLAAGRGAGFWRRGEAPGAGGRERGGPVAGGRIELVALTKRFTEIAVDAVDLTVDSGEFFSLLGPSGCGKTTTLRLIAGFEQPTQGKILLDGADVSAVPAHRRNVNTVFQSYALFPFLSVFDNVAFGLRHRHLAKPEITRRVGEALELVRLTEYAKRRPSMLSGGQQQRVALARALVLNPAVLLLDEPLGALDAKLRRSLTVELKALQERVGITFLYVTHDQEEALTMSDRLGVMNAGRIMQIGTPREVYEEPADTYVADFLGVSNLMEVEVVERRPGTGCQVRLGEAALVAGRGAVDGLGPAHAVIRPERVRIEPYGSAGPNRVPAMVERLVFHGAATQVLLRLGPGVPLQALVQNDGDTSLAQGTPVHVFLPPDALRVLGGAAREVPVDAEQADPLIAR